MSEIDAIPEDLVLGYPRGYSDQLAHEFSDPADSVGLDWNGLHQGAQFGECWAVEGWDDSGREAEHVTVPKLVRHSLGRIKAF